MQESFNLFISHKSEDADIAEKIRDALNHLINKKYPDTLECFLSERITHGQDWLSELHSELHQATFLVLIFTDPDEDWSWCMYEAGYFSALRYLQERDPFHTHALSRRRRTFCLHHAELAPPSPLAHLQATRATEDRVKQMIHTLLHDLNVPSDAPRIGSYRLQEHDFVHVDPEKKITEEEIAQAVAAITKCFSHRDVVRHKTPTLTLTIKGDKDADSGKVGWAVNPRKKLTEALPPDSYFVGSDESLRAVFQRSADRGQLAWKEAVETSQGVAPGDGRSHFDVRWLDELVEIMYNASRHYYPQTPVHGLVFTGANGVIYSPVIRRISENRKGKMSCEIIFLKWEGHQYPRAPEHVRQLLIAVRMATRFQQEFLVDYKDIAKQAEYEVASGLGATFRSRLWRAYFDVRTEGSSRGLDLMRMSPAFSEKGREKLRVMAMNFAVVHSKLARIIGADEELSTSLVEERADEKRLLEGDNLEALSHCYKVMSEINFEFLAMANIALERYFASARSDAEWIKTKQSLADAVEGGSLSRFGLAAE